MRLKTEGARAAGHRQRALTVVGVFAMILAGVGVATAWSGVLRIEPSAGPPGTPYTVRVKCPVPPTIFLRTRTDSPPGTLPQPEMRRTGPSEWTYNAVANRYDDLYSTSCDDKQQQERFDSNSPRLYLGPVSDTGPMSTAPYTRIEGTDCPDGTRAAVTITVDGRPASHDAAIDRYGDWAVGLPVPFGSKTMVVQASCGAVHYSRFAIAGTTTTTTSTSSPTVTTAPSSSDNCRTVYQDPVAGQPVVTQVIYIPTGQVVAERTGTGPFVPADYAAKCRSTPSPPPASPAQPMSGASSLTG